MMVMVFLYVLGRQAPYVTFFDNTNLLMHESGHVFFGGGGELISALGGTIMQILVPVFVIMYFELKRKKFESGFGLFWLGQNLVNISIYIRDARTKLLPLINDGTHDWNKILTLTGGLKNDVTYANIVLVSGKLLMATVIIWSAYYLFDRLKKRAARPLI